MGVLGNKDKKEINIKNDKNQQVKNDEVICYNCNEKGHMSFECTIDRRGGTINPNGRNTGNNVVGPKCYSCNELGHIERNCPLVICRKCGVRGHIQRNCPGPVNNIARRNYNMGGGNYNQQNQQNMAVKRPLNNIPDEVRVKQGS